MSSASVARAPSKSSLVRGHATGRSPPGTGKPLAILTRDAGDQVQHRVSIADCLSYLFRVEQVEFGRRRSSNVMTAVT